MDKDLDKKLYNDYLKGDMKSFELLYLKYKDKIKYFVYNIIKDYEKAEDITQEVFIYVLKNKVREKGSFKYYIFLVAKSRAIDYLNTEKRRDKITKKYLTNDDEKIEKDVLEIITKQEEKEELLKSINLLNDKYKNVIYLNKIEGFSYEQTAKILNTSISNVKNLIHRGKLELQKILIRKGLKEMKKTTKIVLVLLCTTIILSGVVYAVSKILDLYNNITMNPTYESTLDENTINNLWVGTLDLAWKDLAEKVGGKIELEEENIQIANDLNASTFSKEMLDSNDYEINVERTPSGGYKITADLKKELNFLEPFDDVSKECNWTFGDGEEYIKYFGINNASSEEINKNVEILFYNKTGKMVLDYDFAVKLKTKEGDEIILYRTDENKSFDEYYEDIKNKTSRYTGSSKFGKEDEIVVPYVKVNGIISYNELFGKTIKNTNGLFIKDVVQNVNFSLNESGCNLSSQAKVVSVYLSESMNTRYCYFKDTFIIFMKEENSDTPYFALKVDNSDILEKK